MRGITRGKGTLSAVRSSGKLKVDFDFNSRKVVGPNSSRFNNKCGYIYRHKGSFSYTEWRKVPEAIRAPLREDILVILFIFLKFIISTTFNAIYDVMIFYLQASFDLDLDDQDVCRAIDAQFAKACRNVKTSFHEHFIKIGGKEDLEAAKRNPHHLLQDRISDWIFLCDLYSDPKYVVCVQFLIIFISFMIIQLIFLLTLCCFVAISEEECH